MGVVIIYLCPLELKRFSSYLLHSEFQVRSELNQGTLLQVYLTLVHFQRYKVKCHGRNAVGGTFIVAFYCTVNESIPWQSSKYSICWIAVSDIEKVLPSINIQNACDFFKVYIWLSMAILFLHHFWLKWRKSSDDGHRTKWNQYIYKRKISDLFPSSGK